MRLNGFDTAASECIDADVNTYLRQSVETPRYEWDEDLDNCHSGVTKNHAHHIEICEREVDPSDACIRAIEAMTCDQLEAGPARVAPQVCGKRR